MAASQTRILMLLPLKKDKHFVEFYEGFLLGMYQLKKSGISMQLTTLDVPNDEALNAYIDAGKLRVRTSSSVVSPRGRSVLSPQLQDTTTISSPSARPATSRRVMGVSS